MRRKLKVRLGSFIACCVAMFTMFAQPAMALTGTNRPGCIQVDIVIHWQKLLGQWVTADSGYSPGGTDWPETYSYYGPAWNDWLSQNSDQFWFDANVEFGTNTPNITYYGYGYRLGFRTYNATNYSAVHQYSYFENQWPGYQHHCSWAAWGTVALDGNGHYQWYVTLHTWENW